MSLTATCGVVAVVSVLLVMWERAPVRTVSRRYCYAESPYRTKRSRTANEAAFPRTGGASKTEGTYNRYERGLLRLRRAGPQRNL